MAERLSAVVSRLIVRMTPCLSHKWVRRVHEERLFLECLHCLRTTPGLDVRAPAHRARTRNDAHALDRSTAAVGNVILLAR